MTCYPYATLLRRIWNLRENLTAYDAAYVALSEALDAPLITRDARLAQAPGNHAIVELYHVNGSIKESCRALWRLSTDQKRVEACVSVVDV